MTRSKLKAFLVIHKKWFILWIQLNWCSTFNDISLWTPHSTNPAITSTLNIATAIRCMLKRVQMLEQILFLTKCNKTSCLFYKNIHNTYLKGPFHIFWQILQDVIYCFLLINVNIGSKSSVKKTIIKLKKDKKVTLNWARTTDPWSKV